MTLRTHAFSLPLEEPLSSADGRVTTRRGVLVGVEVDGTRGVGEATPLPGWTETYGDCRAVLDDLDEPDPAAVPAGNPATRHALEGAHLDVRARDAGTSLATVLGDSPVDRVPVNATIGEAGTAETVGRARDAVDAGFACLKLKVGARDLARDLQRLRAVRDAVGDDVALRVDANGSWDRPTAEEALAELADLDVGLVEQPLPADDLAGLADLPDCGVDVAADESLVAHGLDAVVEAGAADVAVLKPMTLGGPRRALSVAARALDADLDPIVTTTVDGAVARAAAVHVAACLPEPRPCGLATASRLAEDLCPDPAPVGDGTVAVPGGPGTCGDAVDELLWD